MLSWGKFWTKGTKRPNPTATSEEPGAKAGYYTCPLHSTPPDAGQNTKAIPPVRPMDTPLPSPHIRNQLAPTPSGSKQGHLLLDFAPSCYSRSPSKDLPEFLVWPLINFYGLGKAKNRGRYQ